MGRIVLFALLVSVRLSGQGDAPGVHGYLGVGVREIRGQGGVEITQVDENSPAAKAGLQVADVVLEYNGRNVEGGEQFSRMVRETPAGRTARLEISRKGTRRTLIAAIATRSAGAPRLHRRPGQLPSGSAMAGRAIFGIEGEALHGQLARYFGVTQGVLVRQVRAGTEAARAGLKAGDVIVSVGDVGVAAPSDLAEALGALPAGAKPRLRIVRDRRSMVVEASPGGWQPARP